MTLYHVTRPESEDAAATEQLSGMGHRSWQTQGSSCIKFFDLITSDMLTPEVAYMVGCGQIMMELIIMGPDSRSTACPQRVTKQHSLCDAHGITWPLWLRIRGTSKLWLLVHTSDDERIKPDMKPDMSFRRTYAAFACQIKRVTCPKACFLKSHSPLDCSGPLPAIFFSLAACVL